MVQRTPLVTLARISRREEWLRRRGATVTQRQPPSRDASGARGANRRPVDRSAPAGRMSPAPKAPAPRTLDRSCLLTPRVA